MIRPAAPSDAAQIAAFWNPFIRDTAVTFNAVEKDAVEVTKLITDRPAFLVAVEQGQIVGFATYDQFRGGVGYRQTMEHTIILSPDIHGKGIGRALMTGLFDIAQEQGVHSMWAGISSENADGVRFHERLGFEQVAILPEVGRKFDRWMDLVLMRKAL